MDTETAFDELELNINNQGFKNNITEITSFGYYVDKGQYICMFVFPDIYFKQLKNWRKKHEQKRIIPKVNKSKRQ